METREQICGQRGVKIIGDVNGIPVHAQWARGIPSYRGHKTSHGNAGAGDGDLLSLGDALKDPGEVRLGLVNVDLHKVMVD